MEQMQQTVFKNLARSSVYNSQVKKVSQRYFAFPKYRLQEIENEFDLVDLHGRGKLTEEEIVGYLRAKYQWINMNILNEVFKTIEWYEGSVTKHQFCNKYLDREKKVFHQIKRLKSFSNWSRTQKDIYTENLKHEPRVYVFAQVAHVELFYNGQKVDYMDLFIDYENHRTGVNYAIEQLSHEAEEPSYQIWLPVQEDSFFMTLRFLSPKNNSIVYGRSYVREELGPELQKNHQITADITIDNKIVGHCNILMRFESSMETVKTEIINNRHHQVRYQNFGESKIKEYEYLQFLWGMKYRSPEKISQLDVPWMLAVRTIFIILLGILGLIVHIYGRCQPLSFVLAVLLLKSRQYVLLPADRFMMAWLTLAAILLDVIWLVFASNHVSQISFSSLTVAQILTYVLLGTKGFLLAYLAFFEKSFQP